MNARHSTPQSLCPRPGVRSGARRAAAAVECAVCLPLLLAIVFGSIETSHVLYVKRALQTAAYEAGHTACDPTMTATDVTAKGNAILQTFQVHDAQITLAPANITQLAEGTHITITVAAPLATNRLMPAWFFGAGNFSTQCTVVRE